MALLSEEKRKKYFEALGLGAYTKSNIEKFQRTAFTRSKDIDGEYGVDTDMALRHWYNVNKYTKNFRPEEFKCECGGRYCTGYPSYMKGVELKHLQSIRDHFGKPMTITCGLRCRPYNNSLTGSIPNSKHLTGYATDFYMKGVTDTLANRKASIKWIKKLPNHGYTYGNGINSYGVNLSAPYMGNALHTDANKPVSTAKKSKTRQQKMVEWAENIAKDDSFHYVHYDGNDPKTRRCPICNKYPKGKYHGWYCTRWNYSVWKHGGELPIKCIDAPNNGQIELIYKAGSKAQALKLARKYFKLKDIQVIVSKSGISQKALKAGDLCYYFRGTTCQHAFFYIGDGEMIDANSLKDGIAVRKAMSCKVAIRYVGK